MTVLASPTVGAAAADRAGAADEAALWRAFRSGSDRAREALFSHYALFARQIAGRHFRRALTGEFELQELRQLAYAGLLEALDHFDPDRGVPFRGYAARRIAGSVLDGLAHATELREQITFRNRLRAERLRSLSDTEADQASASDALRALAELATGLAIGFLLDSGLMATETTADRHPTAYDGVAWKETVQGLVDAVAALPEREQFIIRQHYLHGVAFELIAKVLNLSKGRISQLHKAAIGQLRRRLADPPDFIFER